MIAITINNSTNVKEGREKWERRSDSRRLILIDKVFIISLKEIGALVWTSTLESKRHQYCV